MKVTPDTPGIDDPGPGRRIGIDVGSVRIGVASSDRDAKLATPVETVPRVTGFNGRDGADIDRLIELIGDYRAVEVIVGLPRDLKGNGSHSVKHAKEIAFRLKRRLQKPDNSATPVAIRLGDERLTTVVAARAMRESGLNEQAGRKFIDQAAAVEILQTWLDARINYLAQAVTPQAAQSQNAPATDMSVTENENGTQ